MAREFGLNLGVRLTAHDAGVDAQFEQVQSLRDLWIDRVYLVEQR